MVENNIKELIEYLNSLKILQTSGDFFEQELEDSLDKLINSQNWKELTTVDNDAHRWYELGIKVFQTDLGVIGILQIVKLYSEQSEYEDIHHHYEFYEMEPLVKISYKKLNNN